MRLREVLMSVIRWMWIQPSSSGDPADTRVNTLHFSVPDPDTATYDLIAAAIEGEWNVASDFFGAQVSWPNYRHKAYNLDDPEIRAPVYEAAATGLGTAPTGDSLPAELCVCLSFEGAQVSGQSQARRRGRIYVGPINKDHSDGGYVTSAAATGIAGIGAGLLAASDAAAGVWRWVIWSPTTVSAVNVVDGWADNAFDIQRRRGFAPTTRYLFGP